MTIVETPYEDHTRCRWCGKPIGMNEGMYWVGIDGQRYCNPVKAAIQGHGVIHEPERKKLV